MFQAKLRGWKRLAAGLLLGSGLTAVGIQLVTQMTEEVQAQERRSTSEGTGKGDKAERLMKQAREAFDRGDYDQASEMAQAVKGMGVVLPFWEDSPDQLLSEIARKQGKTRGVTRVGATSDPTTPPMPGKNIGESGRTTPTATQEDPRGLLQRGKAALEAGDLESAYGFAQQAEINGKKVSWGVFEDTPATLLRKVQKAKNERDRAEAERLLANARQYYEKKARDEEERATNLDRARAMAQQAEVLHGPYSWWDMGDRPATLLKEIDVARARIRVTKKPPQQDPEIDPRAMVLNKTDKKDSKKDPEPKNNSSYRPIEPLIPIDLTPKLDPLPILDDPQGPGTVVGKTKGGDPSLKLPGDPSLVIPDVLAKPDPIVSREAPKKGQAVRLMQEAHAKTVAGKFIEAKELLHGAQRLNADFGAEEESPDMAMQALNAAAQKRINSLCSDAHAATMKKDAKLLAGAEQKLAEAEKLALGMALDASAVSDHRVILNAVRSGMGEPTVSSPAVEVPIPRIGETAGNTSLPKEEVNPNDPGQILLKQAQDELRRGELENANRIVNQILTGPYTCKDDANRLLKTINAEGMVQKQRTARRSFENAVFAYQERNYDQALAVFKQIDPRLLDPNQRAALNDMMGSASKEVAARKEAKRDVVQAANREPSGDVTDPTTPRTGADSLLKQQESMQNVQFSKLRAEGLKLEAEATARFGKGETDGAMQDLQGFIARVKAANLEPARVALLTRPIETRIERLKILKHQTDFLTKEARDLRNQKVQMTQEALYQQHKQEQISQLVKDYKKLMDEGKYKDASATALKVRELDPDDPIGQVMMMQSKTLYNKNEFERGKEIQAEWNLRIGNKWWAFGPAVDTDDPVRFDGDRWQQISGRADYGKGIGSMRSRSPQEREIESRLNSKSVTMDFKGATLEQVIRHLQTATGVNIVLDYRSLEAKQIDPKTAPISVTLTEAVPLGSALNVVLDNWGLKWIIEDNVLKVTTPERARGKSVRKVFAIADLVVPVQNYTPSPNTNLDQMLMRVMDNSRPTFGGANTPFTPGVGLGPNTGGTVGSPSTGGRLDNNPSRSGTNIVKSSAQGTIEESLIRLITNSVKPDTWAAVGGAGTIEYFPLGMVLVVNQTPDVVTEVELLLEQLRRLQDLEIAIEVRMITLAETFFERIGLDFSMNLPTKHDTNDENAIITGNFAPTGLIQKFGRGIKNTIIGLQAPGVPTRDLDLPIRATSFAQAIPPFGGYSNAITENGGLALGLAFLNDIQVSMFLEAAQGDRRTNVMQAPKLTMFNGQSANISIQDQQFFLLGINVTTVNGLLVFSPQNQPIPLGAQLFMQPVVSGDRRFVRLNIQQSMTNLASATVPLFPVTTVITPQFEGGFQGQPVPFTQYIQQPTFSTITVQTTVVVPDGGTVVLGGLKTLSEGRNEFGPPVLSKIPYISRLFKNVGYGREGQSLMMMVTPRIIINREEELKQTGIDGNAEQP